MAKLQQCTGQSAGLQERRCKQLESAAEAVRLYAHGYYKTTIAEHYGVHRNTVNHWLRNLAHVDAETVLRALGPDHVSLVNRLVRKSVLRKDTGCWEWVGKARSNTSGYGSIRYRGRQWIISRLVWSLVHGYPKDFVLHKCDNPPCFNPEHLFPGTAQDNADDAKRKGRLGKKGLDIAPAIPPGMYEWRGKLRKL